MDQPTGILSYISSYSNYRVTNQSNLFNFLLIIFNGLESDQQKQFIIQMKLIMGMTFYKEIRTYVFIKQPDHIFLSY